MAATEKIGGVELSTYGLRLARLDGNVDFPAFKGIIEKHDFESTLLILDEKTIRIKMFGFYATRAAMGTALSAFSTKVKSELKQIWTFSNHEFEETCVVKDGVQTTTFGTAVEIVITLTITTA